MQTESQKRPKLLIKPSHTRGYALQCHLKTTLTHLTNDKKSYTHFRGINVSFKKFTCTFTRKIDLFFHPNYMCPTKTSELRYRHLYIIQKFQDT